MGVCGPYRIPYHFKTVQSLSKRVWRHAAAAARAIPLPIGDTGKCPEGYRSRGHFISVCHMAWRSPWIALCTSSLIYILSQFRAERAALRLADGQWTDGNPGTRLMSIPDAFELGRLKNLRRFGDAPG